MSLTETGHTNTDAAAGPGRATCSALPLQPRCRVRVDGKFLAHGAQRFRVQGVTYGPFQPGPAGDPFPERERARQDFDDMRAAGINSIRIYDLPPEWLLHLADEAGLTVLVDVPWSKHLCFLDTAWVRQEARRRVHQAAKRGQAHPCLLAYSVCNEIPPNVVRWYGARRVQQFLAELADVAKQADPEGLVTYANFPSTEYLDLPFLDFSTFNVYLHDPETFRRYLFRLHNLVGDRPLLLGELGMDSLRQGELAQASFLQGHVKEAMLLGLAGAYVFAWTDDWYTGGHQVQGWAFGITDADRVPRPAYHALREVFEEPRALLAGSPRVSVVVCSYNGGTTLEQCLRSLLALDYPDYEVVVVNDGSTDQTCDILARFPQVRALHQPNRGLSAARNAGLRATTGSVIAYTDSDCFADPDWLTHLVHALRTSDAAAVGGPNLPPEDGWLAGCVAAAPGQPTHVLESEQVAEHIPGCNMAFRREALEAINGFDPIYRKAGDDVDVCWRLQQAGYWITFAPGGFVWHHRRQNPRAYLRQQAGYGEAEALLRFKHPDKFNSLGSGKWRGVLYGLSLQGLSLGEPVVYHGTFGTGLFQCLYRPGPAHWAMLPSTLEWHAGVVVAFLAGLLYPWACWLALGLLALSLAVASLQAATARLGPTHDGLASRLVVAGLCYAQPLVRSWKRYFTRWFAFSPPSAPPDLPAYSAGRFPLLGRQQRGYWSPGGVERTELLGLVIASLLENRWGTVIDPGWSPWDLEVHCHPWTVLRVTTAQEEHGGNNRLIRVRFRLRPSGRLKMLLLSTLVCAGLAAWSASWPLVVAGIGLLAGCLGDWYRGAARAGMLTGLVNARALELGMTLLTAEDKPVSPGGAVGAGPGANGCAG